MIEFLQDYVTKSIPPETFKAEERVERSTESELYFVRLGAAAFVTDDGLVDADYHPIATTPVVAVVATDRRFAAGGRAGEAVGLAAPQRATTGPGNAVVFGGQPESTSLLPVETEQLRADLATALAQIDEHREDSAKQADALTLDLTTAQKDREAALVDLAKANEQVVTLTADVETLQARRAEDDATIADLRAQLTAKAGSQGNATPAAGGKSGGSK